MQLLGNAMNLRSTLATERNALSSRSHAVCNIYISSSPTAVTATPMSETARHGGGKITLVDLAGSERKYETTSMSAKDHRESAEINVALMALKDCIRAYNGAHKKKGSIAASYRRSMLTRVLKECFTGDAHHKITIIACVSPTTCDMNHTLNTLNHVTMMSPDLQHKKSSAVTEVQMSIIPLTTSIDKWSPAEVTAWLTNVDGGRFAHIVLPPGLDGRGLLQLSSASLSQLFVAWHTTARAEQEGSAWVERLGTRRHDSYYCQLGNELLEALRREEHDIARRRFNPR